MQACIYEQYGPADVVRVAEVARPTPKPDELLVRVHATQVTTADWRFRASAFPPASWLPVRLMVGLFRPRNPVLGMDFSGVVEAIGENVSEFRVGEAVFGSANWRRRGAHAEYLAVQASDAVIRKPSTLTHVEAAAIPFGGNTALAFLRDFARLQPGQRVLIVGASGGVGSWAVQLARHLGAHVTGVSSARNAELVRSLGAHQVIDYASEPLARKGAGYDVVFDTVGVTTFVGCRDALSERGTYLPLNTGLKEMVQALFSARSAGKRVKFAVSQNTRESLAFVAELVAAGTLRPVIDRVYPMAEIAEAHRSVEGRHKRGSVIVETARGREFAAADAA